jgi:hypothetical protein
MHKQGRQNAQRTKNTTYCALASSRRQQSWPLHACAPSQADTRRIGRSGSVSCCLVELSPFSMHTARPRHHRELKSFIVSTFRINQNLRSRHSSSSHRCTSVRHAQRAALTAFQNTQSGKKLQGVEWRFIVFAIITACANVQGPQPGI